MVAPNATALGRPSELVVSTVKSIGGAAYDTLAQVSSPKEICIWVVVAVAIMLAEGLLAVFLQPTPLCEYDMDGGSRSLSVDAHMVLLLALLFPLFSGALLTVFVAHRHRYMVGSKLHFWTLIYAFAVFALSWTRLLETFCRCNQEHGTLRILFSRFNMVAYLFATSLLFWLSIVKLRCLKAVAPSVARVGEMCGLVGIFMTALSWFFRIFVKEETTAFVGALRVCAYVVGWVATPAFFGILVMLLLFSANGAMHEASQSDVDDASACRLKILASWTRWTLMATVFAASTMGLFNFFSLLRWMEWSPRVVILQQCAFALDQFTNVVVSGLLSGIFFGDGGREYGTTNLRVAAESVRSQQRRIIEQQLISVAGASAGSALTVAYLMDGVAPTDVLREAELRFRCTSWEALAGRGDIIIGGGPLDVIGPGDDDLYSLSNPCHLGDCDAFVSHSWHDDGLQKWEALRSWCDDFVQVQGYHPRLWIDKICICQNEIETDLRCLPVFLAGCKRLLIISGPTYPTRLWCAVEVLVHRAVFASDANRGPPEILLLGDDKQRNNLQQAWSNFDVFQCNCFNREDKRRFLCLVSRYPGGSTGFNRFIRTIAADLSALSEASTPTDGYDFVTRC